MPEDWKQSGNYQKGPAGGTKQILCQLLIWQTSPVFTLALQIHSQAENSLTLSCYGVNLFHRPADSDLVSFKSEAMGYSAGTVPALAQFSRTVQYVPSRAATVVTAPADWKSMKASQQDCPQRLQTWLSSRSPFLQCLKIWILLFSCTRFFWNTSLQVLLGGVGPIYTLNLRNE